MEKKFNISSEDKVVIQKRVPYKYHTRSYHYILLINVGQILQTRNWMTKTPFFHQIPNIMCSTHGKKCTKLPFFVLPSCCLLFFSLFGVSYCNVVFCFVYSLLIVVTNWCENRKFFFFIQILYSKYFLPAIYKTQKI